MIVKSQELVYSDCEITWNSSKDCEITGNSLQWLWNHMNQLTVIMKSQEPVDSYDYPEQEKIHSCWSYSD